tara:strand:- start:50 stop:232 length:183 start_codon:yes stop_codon:yes gene_type:complete
MKKLNKEQNKEIKKILKNPNDENRLIELKQYLSSFASELKCDYAQLAYNIYMENLKPKNK